MVFKNLCILLLGTNVASALEGLRWILCTTTSSCLKQPKQPDNFGDIFLTRAKFRKYLKESCSSGLHLQLSLKYFASLCFVQKLFSKVCVLLLGTKVAWALKGLNDEVPGAICSQEYSQSVCTNSRQESWESLEVTYVPPRPCILSILKKFTSAAAFLRYMITLKIDTHRRELTPFHYYN